MNKMPLVNGIGRMMERMGTHLPFPFVNGIQRELNYLDSELSARKVASSLLLMGIALGMLTWIICRYFFVTVVFSTVFGIIAGLLSIAIAFIILDLKADSRGKKVEMLLPDALQLISSNIKAGLTTERALLASARPEFGALSVELKRASTKILSGDTVEEALIGIPKKIKSKTLQQTFWLISKGINAGGEIADLLLQLSKNLRDQISLQAEVKASISIYLLLIFFSAAFGGPALYAVSTFIVQVMSAQSLGTPHIDPSVLIAAGSRSGVVSGFINKSGSVIKPEFVLNFSMILLFISGIFSSLLLGAIGSGKEKYGVKYIPIIILISFGLLFVIRAALIGAFGNLLLH